MSLKDIHIPDDKDPEDYHYTERRAEIFRMVLEAGHPDRINKTGLAERYGVANSTITKDFKRIRDSVREELGGDVELVSEAVYQKAVKELMDEGEWWKAVRVIDRYNDWLFRRGEQVEEPRRVEVEDRFKEFVREAKRRHSEGGSGLRVRRSDE